MTTLCLILLGDQLSSSLSSLKDAEEHDLILMCEVMEEATYVRHHPKKIAFLFSAMRHFAEQLKEKNFKVRYVCLDDADNTGSLDGEVRRAINENNITRVVVTEPGEYRVLEKFKAWQEDFGLDVEIRPDNRFLCSIDEFKLWAEDRQQLRMEYFYREMPRKHFVLIQEDGNPTSGQWNFDKENRKSPPHGLVSPKRLSHSKDKITLAVLALVKARFLDHFGNLEPFHYAVTREQALQELKHFIAKLLPHFGDYQDVMVRGEAYFITH